MPESGCAEWSFNLFLASIAYSIGVISCYSILDMNAKELIYPIEKPIGFAVLYLSAALKIIVYSI